MLLNGGNLKQAFVAGVIGGAIGAATGFLSFAAGSSNTPVADGDVVFSANASVAVDGNIIETKPLVNGFAKFNLPASQNVTLVVRGGWIVRYNYGGAAVPVYHPVFFPLSLNFKDTFKLK